MVVLSLGLIVANLWDHQQQLKRRALEQVELAREMMDKAQYRAALNRLDEALALDPNLFDVRVTRGEVYRAQQDYEAARRELIQAVEINPDSYRARFALGLTYLQERKVYEAISEIRRCIALRPTFSEAYYILAQAYELSGEKANALEYYQNFLKMVREDDAPTRSKKIPEYVSRAKERIAALK
ncbi:MAG TPA: tetratricopeptide repeat protein, partial [Candidatus Nitrosotenuis sp.]|nr:tetratricopeptide repeat protein [Candidatus Nitrosotenuis sp.]